MSTSDHHSINDQDDLNDMAKLIQILNSSLHHTTSISAQDFSCSTLFELLSPSQINLCTQSEEERLLSKEANQYTISDNIMSTYSPSSTISCQSPRTIHSNLSTPTSFSQTIIRFEDNITGSENSLHFSNPFIKPSREQTAYLHAKGSQSVPITIRPTMQSYFEPSNNQYPEISQTTGSGNQSFEHQSNNLHSTQRQPSASTHNTYIPQFGRPFTTKMNNQNYDERYWMNEQASASSQIKDFDMLIESLAAQATTKMLPDRKRAPSKTFEDIMPYLSDSTVWNNDIFGNVEALKMNKRSKTDISPWQARSKDECDQHASWLAESMNRQRQRSKTTSIVYPMKNAPIIPLKPTFSELKEEIHLSPKQASGLVGAKSLSDQTNVELTTCKFVEQAARTALKGAKIQNDSEVSKRALAGMKARDEQNREKSKRYYDRKKAQSSAMSGLCNAIELWQSTYGINMVDSLQTDLDAQQAANLASQEFQLPSERQKALKEMQRLKESAQIKTLMTCADKLNQLLIHQPKGSAAEIVVSHSNNNQSEASQTFRSKEFFILQSGLHIWLDYLHCWSDLVLAEKRLADKSSDKPICQIIRSLMELL